MNKIKFLIIPACLIFTTSVTLAGMYKWVDQEGNISYSDQPPFKGAETLEAPALTTTPTIPVTENKSATAS